MLFQLSIGIGIAIIIMASLVEFMDSTIGMGYGTTLTPILLLMGFSTMQIVPTILLAEFITGILAAIIHHLMGNADFSIKLNEKNSAEAGNNTSFINSIKNSLSGNLKVAIVLGSCSIIGAIAGVLLAINLPEMLLKIYIGVLVIVIGVYILITRNKQFKFSWGKLMGIGAIASFNKATSGGGYGPVVTGGQIMSGVNTKNAIAITSLAEALTCSVGLLVYLISKQQIDWILAPYLIIGGILSVPLSGVAVKKMKTKNIVLIIGIAIIVLGLVTLLKLFI